MAAVPPNKIVLKSTTKMSLNDRFSAYRKNSENNNTVGAMRQRMQQMMQQTSRNWRLIQQMENRPSVIAALKIKKRSLKQRLGQLPSTSVKSRLSLGAAGGAGPSGRGRGGGVNRSPRFQGRGGGGQQMRRMLGRARGNRRGMLSGGGDFGAGRSSFQWALSPVQQQQQLRRRLGGASAAAREARKRKALDASTSSNGRDARNRLGRGGKEGRRGRGGRFRQARGGFRSSGQFRNTNIQRGGGGGGRNRGNRRGGGGGGGRGGGRLGRGGGQQQTLPSRQTLDNELDEYMSRTKGNLDMELESYMAQAQFE